MKRILCSLLLGAMVAGMLAGCQKTPDSPIVTGKDNNILIEKAQGAGGATAASATAELDKAYYGIADTLRFAQEKAEGKLKIDVNAAVITPEQSLPIMRVEAAEFSQETVSALYKAFIGDMPMVEITNVLTKPQIEEYLIDLRKALAEEDSEYTDKDFVKERIEELMVEYETAPESITPVPVNDILQNLQQTYDGRATVNYTGINANSEDGNYVFMVQNDWDNKEAIELVDNDENGELIGSTIIPLTRNASVFYVHHNDSRPFFQLGKDSLLLNRGDTLPAYAQPHLKLTPEEAAATAEHMLQKAGLSDLLAVSEICLMSDKDPGGGVPVATDYAYYIACTRLVQGSPCANLGSVTTEFVSPMAPTWEYEACSFSIDDDGIYYFEWRAPMQVTETVVEHTSLMHFSEIERIVEKMLPIMYEPEAREEYVNSVELSADSMTLSLQRISEQNAFDRAMLVPAWNVYGFYTRTMEDFTYTERRTLLTINAIDGSIIDASKGY